MNFELRILNWFLREAGRCIPACRLDDGKLIYEDRRARLMYS